MLVTQAYRFALDPTPAQQRALGSHAGAARFAYNWGLGLVRARLDQRDRIGRAALTDQLPDDEVERLARTVRVPWTLAELRREWNAQKARIAPWWAENSKEAASSGLADLAAALKTWSESRRGRRKGRRVGFPRFKGKQRTRSSYRYTTGSFGLSGRCRVQLPRVGYVRTHEPTAKLAKRLGCGEGRILSMTLSQDGGRWYCSCCCEVERHDSPARQPQSVVGVDVGVRQLAVLSTGELVENPRALQRARRRLRRSQRRLERQRRAGNPGCYDGRGRAIPGKRPNRWSGRMRRTERRIARLHARARHVRRDALHKLTSHLASEHGTVVVEHLNLAGMVRNRRLARSLHDASLAEIRRQLAYKTRWRDGTLIEAPVFYPSSKTCSACGAAKAKLSLSERTYRCEHCGLVLDRDHNAARNLTALAERVAASGAETGERPVPINALAVKRHKTEPGSATARPRSPHRHPADKTGTAIEQSKAA